MKTLRVLTTDLNGRKDISARKPAIRQAELCLPSLWASCFQLGVIDEYCWLTDNLEGRRRPIPDGAETANVICLVVHHHHCSESAQRRFQETPTLLLTLAMTAIACL